MENQIILNPRDFYLKTLNDGTQVINLRGGTAFDKAFIQECIEKGVKEEIKKQDDETE